jgi:hypothetical protein|tara:strand:- start:58 stop:330 length:273 start_codon:yes stop_codon:yes gene_type:complete
MNEKEERNIEFNNDLAFNLSITMLKKYGESCKEDEDKGMMDPLLGSYLLVNNLAIGLMFQAEGFESELIDILKSAIDDAESKVRKSRKVS